MLQGLDLPSHPDLVVGFDTRDDAGVFKINQEQALIQTLDFFTPMVDDPYVFGQIAAANALNDVYAMGGRPLLAMNLVCYPQCGDMQVLKEILAGGLSKIKEAGALLVGGHTVDDNEPKYGLSVTGMVHPEHIISNRGAFPGDVIFLSKPIGSGIISTALKAGMVSGPAQAEALRWMSMLNKEGCIVMQEIGVNAATDVTGFGLLGHLFELADASRVEVELYSSQVGLMQEVLQYAGMGLIPAGAYNNRDYLGDRVVYRDDIDPNLREVLFCPETAGGLLAAVSEDKADAYLQAMKKAGGTVYQIGRVLRQGFQTIIIRK